MKILLETNAVIWWMEDNPRLGSKARNILANPQNLIMSSIVSIWEITMKWRTGKHPLPGSSYTHFLEEEGVGQINVVPEHVHALETLGFHHRDPFDQLILAQAKVEGAKIITNDQQMAGYGVPCIMTN